MRSKQNDDILNAGRECFPCRAEETGGIFMVSQKVVIKNPTGLHLRPAGILCKEAMQFKSLITFTFRDSTANAKSVLSVLGACVKCGDEIELTCEGEDEEEALKALVNAIESGLGE
nr:HPr family phosphocarrier protein [Eisenbergiella massiliensis]